MKNRYWMLIAALLLAANLSVAQQKPLTLSCEVTNSGSYLIMIDLTKPAATMDNQPLQIKQITQSEIDLAVPPSPDTHSMPRAIRINRDSGEFQYAMPDLDGTAVGKCVTATPF